MRQKLIRGAIPGAFLGSAPAVFSIEFERFERGRFQVLVKDAAVPVLHDAGRARDRVRRYWRPKGQSRAK